jgi:hypothetical protein
VQDGKNVISLLRGQMLIVVMMCHLMLLMQEILLHVHCIFVMYLGILFRGKVAKHEADHTSPSGTKIKIE